jgi:DNA-directed RNA polymerase I subunit RPA2
LIPVYILLKALLPSSSQSDGSTDVQIFNRLVKGYFKNRQISDRVEVLLSDGHKLGLHS